MAFQPFDPGIREEHERSRPAEGDFPDHESYLVASRSWTGREDDLYDREAFGSLALAGQGCGHCWRLVVSGPRRGTVWDDARGSDVPLSPLTGPAGDHLSFRGWYLDWLAQTEAAAVTGATPGS